MGIGEQQAGGVVEHPAALAPLGPLGGRNAGRAAPGRQPEELPQPGVVEREGGHQGPAGDHDGALRVDRDHRRTGALDRLGHKRLACDRRGGGALGRHRRQTRQERTTAARQQKAGHPCRYASHPISSKSAKP